MSKDIHAVIEWLGSGDTGMSSKALAFEFLGNRNYPDMASTPLDPADLGRCLRLIDKVPAVRGSVDTLAARYESWGKMAPVWDVLAESMAVEVGIDWSKGKKAPVTYKNMQPYTRF